MKVNKYFFVKYFMILTHILAKIKTNIYIMNWLKHSWIELLMRFRLDMSMSVLCQQTWIYPNQTSLNIYIF